MKNLKSFAGLAIAALALVSCEQTDLELPINFTKVISENVTIEAGQGTEGSVTDTTYFAAADDADFEKNLDKISSLTIDKASYEISNLTNTDSTNFVVASGAVSVWSQDFSVKYGELPLSQITLQNFLAESPKDVADLANFFVADFGNKMLEKLKAGETLVFVSTYSGENQTNQDYSFDLKAKIKFKAVAKIKE